MLPNKVCLFFLAVATLRSEEASKSINARPVLIFLRRLLPPILWRTLRGKYSSSINSMLNQAGFSSVQTAMFSQTHSFTSSRILCVYSFLFEKTALNLWTSSVPLRKQSQVYCGAVFVEKNVQMYLKSMVQKNTMFNITLATKLHVK